MSFRHWADTWVRPYNREVTELPKLKSNSDVDILVEFDRSRNAKENAESDEQGRNVPKSASVVDCPVVALKCL